MLWAKGGNFFTEKFLWSLDLQIMGSHPGDEMDISKFQNFPVALLFSSSPGKWILQNFQIFPDSQDLWKEYEGIQEIQKTLLFNLSNFCLMLSFGTDCKLFIPSIMSYC